jgi:astacin (peptidase family M12A)
MAEQRPTKRSPAKRQPSRQRAAAADFEGEGEFRSSARVKTALIPGNTFHSKAVQYVDIEGLAIAEGDIVLGTVPDVERNSQVLAAERRGELAAGVIITGNQFRWPNCQVPYDIDPGLPDQTRVTDAIAHWQAHTSYTFVLRTGANAATFPDWVTFQASSGCSSSVGKRGGQQFVNLGSGCTAGNAIHEIGHTIGLWHEQSREDRDAFVTIHWDKIQPGFEHNFDQHISDGDDFGVYDYGSIMHYPRNAFSIDGSDTITPVDPTAVIGQRTALSAGDIAAANSLCPTGTVIETVAETIKERIPETIKERIPETLKEQSPETIKERFPETIKEVVPETIKEQGPETIKECIPETTKEFVETGAETLAEGPVPGLGGFIPPVVNPQLAGLGGPPGGVPFAMQTPHAGFAAAPQGDASTAEPLLAQLAAVNAAIEANAVDAATLAAQREQLTAALNQLGWQ